MRKILLIIALCISSFIYGQNTIQFPNDRLVYSSVGNPLFVTDIQNATQSANESMRTLLGMPTSGATSFAILSGFTYTAGSPGTYSAGYVIYADTIYYCSTGTREGKYLKPHTTKIQSKLFQDAISRYTYQVYKIDSFYHSYLSFPVFSGDMNAYRISSSALRNMCNNSLRIDSLRTITKTITSATPIVGADSKASSVLATISGNNAGTNTYNYHIGANTNMVYFNLSLTTGYTLYFNIYNYANTIIKTLTVGNGYLNENFLMINDGTEWIELDGVNGFGTTSGTMCQGNDSRFTGVSYPTDRGDPTNNDYSSFTFNGSWHTLDLTAKGVPTTATFVIIDVDGVSSSSQSMLYIRKQGSSNTYNMRQFQSNSSTIWAHQQYIVALNAGKIEYSNNGSYDFGTLYLTVSGWF